MWVHRYLMYYSEQIRLKMPQDLTIGAAFSCILCFNSLSVWVLESRIHGDVLILLGEKMTFETSFKKAEVLSSFLCSLHLKNLVNWAFLELSCDRKTVSEPVQNSLCTLYHLTIAISQGKGILRIPHCYAWNNGTHIPTGLKYSIGLFMPGNYFLILKNYTQ